MTEEEEILKGSQTHAQAAALQRQATGDLPRKEKRERPYLRSPFSIRQVNVLSPAHPPGKLVSKPQGPVSVLLLKTRSPNPQTEPEAPGRGVKASLSVPERCQLWTLLSFFEDEIPKVSLERWHLVRTPGSLSGS